MFCPSCGRTMKEKTVKDKAGDRDTARRCVPCKTTVWVTYLNEVTTIIHVIRKAKSAIFKK